MSGWAATNTLRVPPGHAPACECSRCEKHAAALALVEAALDAAEEVSRIEATGVLPDFMPLAEALARLDGAR